MNSHVTIRFCFIRPKMGKFSDQIDLLLNKTFQETDFSWELSEKDIEDGELVLAELTGKSEWTCEEEVVHYLNQQADDTIWEYLYGFEIINDSILKECKTCGAS